MTLDSATIARMTRPQRLFLIGSAVGAIASRHTMVWFVAEMATRLARFPVLSLPFRPWLRATVLTGDRLGFVAAVDHGASVDAVMEAMVGHELIDEVALEAVVTQARHVRASMLMTILQWVRAVPFTTERLLELRSFAADPAPPSLLGAGGNQEE